MSDRGSDANELGSGIWFEVADVSAVVDSSGTAIGQLRPGLSYLARELIEAWVVIDGPAGGRAFVDRRSVTLAPQAPTGPLSRVQDNQAFTGLVGLDLEARPPRAAYFDGTTPVVVDLNPDQDGVLADLQAHFPATTGVVLAHYHGPRLRAAFRVGSPPVARSMSAIAAGASALAWPGRADAHTGSVLVVGSVPGGTVAGVAEVGDGCVEIRSAAHRPGAATPEGVMDVADAAVLAADDRRPTIVAGLANLGGSHPLAAVAARYDVPIVVGPLVAEGLALQAAVLDGKIGDLLVLDLFAAGLDLSVADMPSMTLVPSFAPLPLRRDHQLRLDVTGQLPVVVNEGPTVVLDTTISVEAPGVWTAGIDIDANVTAVLSLVDPTGATILQQHLQ
ncbi:MAG: hypothetical protein GY925_23615 [Actinomycetia bacterium]|nr:hypothetical protein [Actinomycetes bacterium]